MSRVGRSNRGSHRRSADQQSQHAARGLVDDADDLSIDALQVVSATSGDNEAGHESSRSRSSNSNRLAHMPPGSPSAPYLALTSPSAYTTQQQLQQLDPEFVQQQQQSERSRSRASQRRPLATPLLSADSESTHLLSPSSNAQFAQDRLNALLYPESRYSSEKQPVRSFYDSQNEFVSSLKKLVTLQATEEENEKPSTAAYLAIQISLGQPSTSRSCCLA